MKRGYLDYRDRCYEILAKIANGALRGDSDNCELVAELQYLSVSPLSGWAAKGERVVDIEALVKKSDPIFRPFEHPLESTSGDSAEDGLAKHSLAEDPPAEDPPAEDPPAEDPPEKKEPAEDKPAETRTSDAGSAEHEPAEDESPRPGRKWVHVPFASGPAVLAVAKTAPWYFGTSVYDSWCHHVDQILVESSILPAGSDLAYREPLYHKDLWRDGTFVVFPCLMLNTIEYMTTRDRVRTQLREALSEETPREQKVREEYEEGVRSRLKNEDCSRFPGLDTEIIRMRPRYRKTVDQTWIQFPRTLDEAYYPGLDAEVLRERNHDQTVTKQYEREHQCRSSGESAGDNDRHPDSPILMVSSLWMFNFGSFLITAGQCPEAQSPHDTFHKIPGPVDGSARKNVWVVEPSRSASINMQMGLAMLHHIESFGRKSHGEEFLAPLDLFERAVVSILTSATHYSRTTKRSSKMDKQTESDIVHGIADIRDELVMIKAMLLQQQEVLDKYFEDLSPRYNRSLREDAPSELSRIDREQQILETFDWDRIKTGRQRLQQYLARVDKISNDAERIQQTMDSMLNMKRAHAAVEDTRSSIIIGVAALGFAIVTIIYTPLAFLTSLWALPIDGPRKYQEPLKDDTSERVYRSDYIGGTFAGVEIQTLIVTMAAVWGILKVFGMTDYLHDSFQWTGGKTWSRSKRARSNSTVRSVTPSDDSNESEVNVTEAKQEDQEGNAARRSVASVSTPRGSLTGLNAGPEITRYPSSSLEGPTRPRRGLNAGPSFSKEDTLPLDSSTQSPREVNAGPDVRAPSRTSQNGSVQSAWGLSAGPSFSKREKLSLDNSKSPPEGLDPDPDFPDSSSRSRARQTSSIDPSDASSKV